MTVSILFFTFKFVSLFFLFCYCCLFVHVLIIAMVLFQSLFPTKLCLNLKENHFQSADYNLVQILSFSVVAFSFVSINERWVFFTMRVSIKVGSLIFRQGFLHLEVNWIQLIWPVLLTELFNCVVLRFRPLSVSPQTSRPSWLLLFFSSLFAFVKATKDEIEGIFARHLVALFIRDDIYSMDLFHRYSKVKVVNWIYMLRGKRKI